MVLRVVRCGEDFAEDVHFAEGEGGDEGEVWSRGGFFGRKLGGKGRKGGRRKGGRREGRGRHG